MSKKKKVTVKEYLDNIGGICDKHAEERKQEYQKTAKHNYKPGDFVQANISVGDGISEHMWVLVTKVLPITKKIIGNLSNDPLYPASFVKNGDELIIEFKDIEGVLHDYKLD